MRAERAVAVALVCASAAMAATAVLACRVYVDEPPKAATSAPVAPPAPASPAAPAPAASASPPPAQPAATPAAPAAPAAPAKKIAFHLGGPGGAPVPAPAPTPGPAAACLDQAAVTVPDCATLQAPSPACAAFTAAGQKCAAYKNNFDAKVAAAAVSCLATSTAAQLCDTTRPSACAQTALAQACADPNVTQLCQIAAAPCKATPAACTATLSGLNSQGQQAVAQCVATGCTAGLAGCLDALK